MEHKLQELVGGALQEKFNKSFEKVLENMQDPNMPYKDKRSITITLTFEQNEARDDAKCGIVIKEKLSPQGAIETRFAVGTNLRTNKIYAREYGKQVKGQMAMEDIIDEETGEISDNATDEQIEEVIDIRKAQEV